MKKEQSILTISEIPPFHFGLYYPLKSGKLISVDRWRGGGGRGGEGPNKKGKVLQKIQKLLSERGLLFGTRE